MHGSGKGRRTEACIGNVDTIVWATPGERPYPGGENEPFLTWVTAVVDGATDGSRPLSNVIFEMNSTLRSKNYSQTSKNML